MMGKRGGLILAGWLAAGAAGAAELTFTVMAANLSGSDFEYDESADRVFQGLKPDIVAIQEWTVAGGDRRAFVDRNFGKDFFFCVENEPRDKVPNGVISRWPILSAGTWDDPQVPDRGFAWARIDLPHVTNDLYVVSVHLHSS
ncbi:MAG TPA: endonuclease, partial [Kiritimatiellia bacterium]|nr:endonuclease [Kiritimatiellia bacterium]